MKNIYQSQIKQGTPCVGVCSVTFDEVCRGCGRTVDEVAQWAIMSEEQREIVWKRILKEGYLKCP